MGVIINLSRNSLIKGNGIIMPFSSDNTDILNSAL